MELLRPFSRAVALPVLSSAVLLPASAQAQTVGYALAPGASYVAWDDDLGIEDSWLWGGAVTLELGPRVRLSPFYLTRTGLEADPAALPGDESALDSVTLDVRHLGVDVDVDLASGSVVPFLRLGGGVLRFAPEERDALKRIALSYGAGLRFGLGRVGVRLAAEGTSYRFAPQRLYDPDFTTDEPEGVRHNLVGSARLSIPISGMPDDPGTGLVSASAPLGLFAGELHFDDDSGIEDQRLAGVRAGIAFNPLVSLQGFYWRGVNDDFDAVQELRAYGGEARFDLGSGTGIAPFLVAGGAHMDFGDRPEDVEDPEAGPREDRTALILGGGLSFRLSDRIALDVAARDYLLDTAGDLEDASDPDELQSNWLYSAGLTVQLGGTTAQSRTERLERERDRLREEVARLRETRTDTMMRADPAGAVVRRAVDTVYVGPHPALRGVDTVMVRPQPGDTLPMQRMERIRTPGGRIITIPVLEEGVVYIRFGPEPARGEPGFGAAVDRTELRRMIRDEVRPTPGDTVGVTERDLDELEERILQRLEARQAPDTALTGLPPALEQRLEALEQRLRSRIDELARPPQPTPQRPAVRPEAEPAPEVVGAAAAETAWDRAERFAPMRTQPHGGIHFGDETQGVLGVRFDFGPLSPGSALRFVPEAAVGLGGGNPSLLLVGNIQYRIGTWGDRDVGPYLLGGAGFYSPTFLGVTTGVGVELDLRTGRENPLRTFLEIEGINLFDRTRLLIGAALSTGG